MNSKDVKWVDENKVIRDELVTHSLRTELGDIKFRHPFLEICGGKDVDVDIMMQSNSSWIYNIKNDIQKLIGDRNLTDIKLQIPYPYDNKYSIHVYTFENRIETEYECRTRLIQARKLVRIKEQDDEHTKSQLKKERDDFKLYQRLKRKFEEVE